MKKIVSVLLVLFACIAFAGIAHAGSVTSNLQVLATVVQGCQVSTSAVNFGDVYANSSTYFANGDVQVNCPLDTPYDIALDAGQSFFPNVRNVSAGQNTIAYHLCKDSAYLTEWGDSDYANTYPYGSSLADTGNGLSQPHTVYGLLKPSSLPAGNYSDSVVVTVYF